MGMDEIAAYDHDLTKLRNVGALAGRWQVPEYTTEG